MLVLVIFILISITTAAFLPMLDNGFVNWDDNTYVYENKHVQSGLTLEGVVWAFSTFECSNWHPLTWLSHMLDVEIYGLKPFGHHLSSLILHLINTLLLFLALRTMTGAFWRSAMAAALFAVHPQHVESVAWIAERKDVLSTFFGLLAIIAYTCYVKCPGLWRYAGVFILIAMGLMAKPMLVTLPFVLLLLDYWPLQRTHKEEHSWLYLIREKIPLFVLSVLSCIVTFLAQKQGGAMDPYKELDITFRLSNAFISYAAYIIKMIFPENLAMLYPLSYKLPIWQTIGSILFVGVISVFALLTVRRTPYLLIGWLWYLGTLLPVIGLVQIGFQSMADRYTYIPFIGLFVAITWGISALLQGFKYRNTALAGLAIIVLSNFTIVTRQQTRYWKDTLTLFSHAADVTQDNWLAYTVVGFQFLKQKRFYVAIYIFEEALRIRPDYTPVILGLTNALNKLGISLIKLGLYEDSLVYLQRALQFNPNVAYTYNNIGFSLFRLGRDKEALGYFEESVRIDPNFSGARNNLTTLRNKLKKNEEEHKNPELEEM